MLKLNKNIILSNQKNQCIFFPKTRLDLENIIFHELIKNNFKCNLNHIDVSNIKDFSGLFFGSYFDGDISEWDVSNAENMKGMFAESKFTGINSNLSNWNVSNVKNMQYMFECSSFEGDLSSWNINRFCDCYAMFMHCPIYEVYEKHPHILRNL